VRARAAHGRARREPCERASLVLQMRSWVRDAFSNTVVSGRPRYKPLSTSTPVSASDGIRSRSSASPYRDSLGMSPDPSGKGSGGLGAGGSGSGGGGGGVVIGACDGVASLSYSSASDVSSISVDVDASPAHRSSHGSKCAYLDVAPSAEMIEHPAYHLVYSMNEEELCVPTPTPHTRARALADVDSV
jgi:hypothetical protein